jgi:hypothetical protein
MLGMIDTPMAIEGYHRATGTPRDMLRKQRDAQVLMSGMGTAWETAKVAVPVDGGVHTRVGCWPPHHVME